MVRRKSFHRLLHPPCHSCDKREYLAVGQMWGWKAKKSHTFCSRRWIWLDEDKQHRSEFLFFLPPEKTPNKPKPQAQNKQTDQISPPSEDILHIHIPEHTSLGLVKHSQYLVQEATAKSKESDLLMIQLYIHKHPLICWREHSSH